MIQISYGKWVHCQETLILMWAYLLSFLLVTGAESREVSDGSVECPLKFELFCFTKNS